MEPTDPIFATISSLLDAGDRNAAAGQSRSATAHYAEALRQAQRVERWPAALGERLAFAREACLRFGAAYEQHLVTQLGQAGFDPARSSERFSQSLDIVLGRKQPFVQQPRYYYFPGLPQVQFYGREAFPWLARLEAATDAIRREFSALLEFPELFGPYLQAGDGVPATRETDLINNPAWSACYLWKNGQANMPVASRCPETLRALQGVPVPYILNRSPSILFSVLQPGTRIPPHCGLVNTRLICHLPLVVPQGCGFRVGNDVRQWQEGRAWLFDDSIEHEAWNESPNPRAILLFEVWKPELDEQERELITRLFAAIDGFENTKPAWSI